MGMRLSLEDLANEAEVDPDYVRRLIEVGALEHEDEPYAPSDARRVRLLRSWEEGGLSAGSPYRTGDLPGWRRLGRTVNLASRIASHAGAGQGLASEETMRRSPDGEVLFQPVGSVTLKGIEKPVPIYQAMRDIAR
jgi:hypothetical protein